MLNSKCQNCGSELIYNPKQGCLTCKYCETNYILPKQNPKAVLVRQFSADFSPNTLNSSLIAYRCNSCGNTYYISSEEMSKKCPNCGANSSVVVEDEGYCADGIIPFKITRQEAAAIFEKHLKKQGSIPKKLRQLAKDQKLMGVFVPVWNFKFNVDSVYSANVTEVKQYGDGSFYSSYRPVFGEKHKRVMSYDESATTAEENEFLGLFDEADYAQIIPYVPEYTFGYRVDKINKDIRDFYDKVTRESENTTTAEVRKKVLSSYKEISNLTVESKVGDAFFNFTYVPVYVNTYQYKGKVYRTYISGTTGKVVGKSPKTFVGFLKTLIKILGVAAVIALLVLLFKN